MPTRKERQGVHRRLAAFFAKLPIGRRRMDEQVGCGAPPSSQYSQLWQHYMGEDWLALQTSMAYMPLFWEMHKGHDGRTCDLRLFFLACDQHLDVAEGLQVVLSRPLPM